MRGTHLGRFRPEGVGERATGGLEQGVRENLRRGPLQLATYDFRGSLRARSVVSSAKGL